MRCGPGRAVAHAQEPPELTQPVNDFAGVIDAASAAEMDALIRSLQQASGDVVVVATVKTFQPYADIREYAVKMFENGGRGIGQRGKDNGLLVLLAVDDRQVWVEVGYDLEQFITDGFAGETSRQYMAPEFRRGDVRRRPPGGRVAHHRPDRGAPERHASGRSAAIRQRVHPTPGPGGNLLFALFVLFIVINALAGRTRRRRRFGGGWGGPSDLDERRRAVRRRIWRRRRRRRVRRRLWRVRRRPQRRRRRRGVLVRQSSHKAQVARHNVG